MIRTIIILFLFLSTWAGAQHGMMLASPAAASGFSPSDLDSLTIWLVPDAGKVYSGSTIVSWESQGTRSIIFNGGGLKPVIGSTLNGYEGTSYNGSASLFTTANHDITNSGDGSYTCFAVVVPSTTSGTRGILNQDGGGGSTRVAQFMRFNGTSVESLRFNTAGGFTLDATGSTISSGTAYLISSKFSPAALEIVSNASTNGSSSFTGTPEINTKTICVGCRNNGISERFVGNIYEIILYSRSISAGEYDSVINYLNTKYSIY